MFWNQQQSSAKASRRWREKLLAASALIALTPAAPALAQEASSSESDVSVAEIVVTARRKAENLQDVPLAVSVVSGEHLEAMGVSNLTDIYLQIPTLRVVNINPRNAAVTIRGIGANLANEALVNSVGVFIDGVYHARPGAAAFSQFDLEQIEVLRGPQGTLFGKNTTAGAINITTRAPTFSPEGRAEISGGDYRFVSGAVTYSGPINDELAGRITVSGKRRDGVINDLSGDPKFNDISEQTVRGQLLWQPSDSVSFRGIADYTSLRTHCCVDVLSSFSANYDNGAAIPNNFYVRAARLGYVPQPIDPFSRRADIDARQLMRAAQYGVSAEANWSVAGGKLTSISAFRRWRFDPHADLDLTPLSVLTNGGFKSRSQQFTQEVRWTSSIGADFDYVAGLFYLNESLRSETIQAFGVDAGGWILPAVPLSIAGPALAGFAGVGGDRAQTESIAAFGQGTLQVGDRLSLTAGVRYTREKKWGFAEQSAVGGAPLGSFAPGLQPTIAAIRAGSIATYDTRVIAGFPQDYVEGNWSGTVSASYELAEDVKAYASFARGHKSGGINFALVPSGASQIIRPEAGDNYELGLKAQLFDRRLTVNTAVFRTDVSDYQSTQLYLNPATGAFTSYITNAAQLRSQGVEVDALALVAPGFSINASVAYTDAKYEEYENAPCALVSAAARCDLSGTRLPNVSKWAVHTGFAYEPSWSPGKIAGEPLRPFLLADISYRSGFYGAPSRQTWIDGYTVTNLTVGIKAPGSGISAAVWAQNLFDEQYYLSRSSLIFNTGVISGSLGNPRTVGVTLRKSF